MSETPSGNDHIDHAEEPSMEDILASIRKIIADDDQGAESSGLETALAPTSLNSKGYASEALVTGSFGSAPSETAPPTAAEMSDKSSVFNELRGPSGLDDILKNDFESDEDFVDLDIEALLSQSDAPLDIFEDAEGVDESDSDDLMDILAMDIPKGETELSINPTANVETGAVLSTGGNAASVVEANLNTNSESLVQPEIGSESDNLMNELESLLADGPETAEDDNFNLIEFGETDDIPEPIGGRNARKGLLGAGLAAVGFGAKSRQKSTPPEIDQIAAEDSFSVEHDDDLDAMLESLIGDIGGEDKTESVAQAALDDSAIAERPSLQTDDDEMDLVKSLMADLTDPEPEVSQADFEPPEAEQLADISSNASDIEIDAEDISDFDIEALLNGDVNEDEIDTLLSGSLEASEGPNGESVSSEAELDVSNTLATAEDDEMDNILDDILDMSLEDELSGHEDDLESFLEIPEPEMAKDQASEIENTEADLPESILEGLESDIVETEALDAEANASEDMLSDLLETDMTPDADSVSADEIENLALNETVEEMSAAELETEEKSSLLEIAMEAEKDADLIEAQAEEAELVSVSSPEPQVDLSDAEADISSDSDINIGAIAAASGLGLAAVAATAAISPETETSIESETISEQTFAEELVSETIILEEAVIEDITPEDIVVHEASTHDASVDDSDINQTHTNLETDNIIQKETANMPSAAAKTETILDEVTTNSTAEVFASLNQVVEEKAVIAERGDRVGDLVMEALRPMLKDWLDANLKGIVERAVAKEVKRISSGK